MKTVLMSIQPKWCELIASGKKIVEVRKTRPKLETPFKCYIYCTNWKDNTYWKNHYKHKLGKVIGEFVCDGIIKIGNYQEADYSYMLWVKDRETTEKLCKDACLNEFAIQDYLGQNGGFGWKISNLVIYDEPKGLHHFFKPCGDCNKKGTSRCTEELTYCRAKVITRPPQSWCYVEEKE